MKEITKNDIGLVVGFFDQMGRLQIGSIYEVFDDYIVTDLHERVAKKDLVDVGFVDLNKYTQLEERVKELESEKHINEIKAQGIEEAVETVAMDCMYDEDPVIVLGRVDDYAEQLRNKYETRD